MHLFTKRIRVIAIGSLLAVTAWAEAAAQVMPYRAGSHCSAGQCGSPLAGPCLPAHATFGYVATQWRRWPVKELPKATGAEELPTPAAVPEEELEPGLPEESPTAPDLPGGGPPPQPSDTLKLPFGEEPSAPEFGADPKLPLFGDEPMPPPSSDDPLAAPMEDEPPAPPAETDAMPAPGAQPSPGEESQTIPGFDELAPPKLPDDDPFKDDPESAPLPDAGSGALLERANQQRHQRMATHRRANLVPAMSDEQQQATFGEPALELPSQAGGEPRLLRADGGTLEPSRLPDEERMDTNPLRPVSHPIRQASAAVQPPRATPAASVRPGGGWRRNPLRSN